jgi:hypothetical protein
MHFYEAFPLNPEELRQYILLIIMIFTLLTGSAQKVTKVETKDLPAPIQKYIRTNLPGAKIFKSVSHEYKAAVQYDVAVDINGKKQVLVFDKSGKFLRKSEEATSRKPQGNLPVKKPKSDSTRQVSAKEKQEVSSITPQK